MFSFEVRVSGRHSRYHFHLVWCGMVYSTTVNPADRFDLSTEGITKSGKPQESMESGKKKSKLEPQGSQQQQGSQRKKRLKDDFR